MAKSNEKSLQFLQAGSQTLLRSLQVMLNPSIWRSMMSFPFRILPGWREIEYVAQKHWLYRLPAVITSAILLYALMSIMGMGQAELVLASLISLAGLACFALLGAR